MYFDSFGIEYTQQVLSNIKDKSIARNIFKVQSNDSIMISLNCIAFGKTMIAGETLPHYTYLFSANGCKKDGKITYINFKDKYRKMKCRP